MSSPKEPMPAHDAPMAVWAPWYGRQGFPIFPCYGKAPCTRNGVLDATTDAYTIERWWRERYKDANIGMATGKTCWVLDIDPRHDGDLTLSSLEKLHAHSGAITTARVLTGGRDNGLHYWFVLPERGEVRNKAKLGPGLDVQAQGAYVIVPPSLHPDTTRTYQWDASSDLDDPGLRQAPDWLLALVLKGETSAHDQTTGHGQPTTAPGAAIPEGERDTTLAHMGIALRHAGCAYPEILAALEVINATRCLPPLPGSALQRIARSVTRYDVQPSLVVGASAALAEGGETQLHPWGVRHDAPAPTLIDLADLLAQDYPTPQWLIPGLIPEGLTFFAGSPKSSKTYLAYTLALSLALQAAHCGQWLGHYDVKMQGPVVYVSLEDDAADSQQRIRELMPELFTIDPGRFLFHHGIELPQLGQGLVEFLETHIIERYHPVLIILDPISYLYSPQRKPGDQFTEVRTMLLPLRMLARRNHIAIIGVDHRRKKSSDDVDVFETLYGSNAKIAIADSLLLIIRDEKTVTIHARVRRASDQTLTLGFTFLGDGTAQWTFIGAADGTGTSGEFTAVRHAVVQTLQRERRPMTILELLAANGKMDTPALRNHVRQILFHLEKSGDIRKTARGMYAYMLSGDDDTPPMV